MSRLQTAHRRLSLLAGSSLLLSSLSAAAALAVVAMPSNAAAQTTTINVAEDEELRGVTTASGPDDLVINNNGYMETRLELGELTGDFTLNVGSEGLWRSSPEGDFGQGNLLITVAEGGIVQNDYYNGGNPTTLDFSSTASSTFQNAGAFVFGNQYTINGLDTFENSGDIVFGWNAVNVFVLDQSWYVPISDGIPDDILLLPGTQFVGSGGQLLMDVDFNGAGQQTCDRVGPQGRLAAADCLMLPGGSTEGVTYLTIRDIFAGDRGAYNPDGIVVVDVSGGESHQGDFVVGPNTPGYRDAFGGVLDKGVFFYAVAYNEDDQKHRLVGLPADNVMQFPSLAPAAQNLWRTSTGTWLDRQADLRGDDHEGIGGGVWLRLSQEIADRDLEHTTSGGGRTFTFDDSFNQSTYAITGGADIINGVEGDKAYVVGVMLGYARSNIEFDTSPNTASFDAWTAGAYASFLAGGFYLDAALNANNILMDNDIPALDLFPEGTILTTRMISLGAQVETGYRFPIADNLFVEPLASVSYIATDMEDVVIRPDDPTRLGAVLTYDDPISLRAAIGARMGLDQDYSGFRAQFSLLGKIVNEFEGENSVVITNLGPALSVADDFSGQFTEFGVGLGLYSPGGAVSGFFNFGGKFGDDYKAANASTGVRVNW